MYKNQLQELAQRSCFNLPSYSCIREGPDHAPRFKATVNFNGETFESPTFCSTLRQAEHAAAEVALTTLANRGPSKALAARVLDETGVYKNLLQETAQRAGLNLPVYTTVRSGPGHVPVFSCTVELVGMSFSGEPAKTKKQAQKNAAMVAWSALKQFFNFSNKIYNQVLKTQPNILEQSVKLVNLSTGSTKVIFLSLHQRWRAAKNRNKLLSLVFLPVYDHQNQIPLHEKTVKTNPIDPFPPTGIEIQHHRAYILCSIKVGLTLVSPAEMAVYQMWQAQQAHLLQLQSRLLSMPAPPSPQVLQHMQSVFQPEHDLYFLAREPEHVPVGPGLAVTALTPSLSEQERIPVAPGVTTSFYVQSNSLTSPIRERSMVSIQEIKEEKTEESSNLCNAEVQEPVREDKQNIGGSETKVEISSGKPEVNTTQQFERVPLNVNSGFRPIQFRDQIQQHNFESYRSNLRPQHQPRAIYHRISGPPSAAAPVMIRTVSHASSVGPRSHNFGNRMPAPSKMRTGTGATPNSTGIEFGRVPSQFIAPAVQIRSVIPVCSAPPVRKTPSSNQVGQSSNQEVKSTGLEEDVSAASSELSKLKM
ncbi:hypothetical protein HYC85_016260 [Camellia sinensis]|uniref:DRBM domain-containing protein n=1 Tax=Camellia sinensis TaxID=4442 RepID=A0A7J7GZ36_CAMSI|nr:hypothetical protein HYC85_016260 [Camellia sinensis]